MKILAIESSTALGSVAILENSQVKAFSSSTNLRTHSEFLNPAVESCLQKSGWELKDIDVFCCGQGPGMFTGIRVAGNIIKSFSAFYNKPLVTVDSLSLLSFQNKTLEPLVCAINAYKNMLYTAMYLDGKCVLAPCALTIPNLENK